MIATIISLIFKIILAITSFIINIIMLAFPNMNLDRLTLAFTGFFGLIGNAIQLTYFIFGPWTYIFADIIIILVTIKHIVLPVINFTRKVLVK